MNDFGDARHFREMLSIRRVLGDCGCMAIAEDEEKRVLDLICDQFLKLSKLLPSRRLVHERHERREHFFLTYDDQENLAWSFANGIAEMYEVVARLGLTHCADHSASVRFCGALAKGLADVSASVWIELTDDFTFYPATGEDGITKMYGELEIREVVISSLAPRVHLLGTLALAMLDPAGRATAEENQGDRQAVLTAASASSGEDKRPLGTSSPERLSYPGLKPLDKLSGAARSLATSRREIIVPILREKNITINAFAADCTIDRKNIEGYLNGTTRKFEKYRTVLSETLATVLNDKSFKLPA
jgi:hypothetical protein